MALSALDLRLPIFAYMLTLSGRCKFVRFTRQMSKVMMFEFLSMTCLVVMNELNCSDVLVDPLFLVYFCFKIGKRIVEFMQF